VQGEGLHSTVAEVAGFVGCDSVIALVIPNALKGHSVLKMSWATHLTWCHIPKDLTVRLKESTTTEIRTLKMCFVCIILFVSSRKEIMLSMSSFRFSFPLTTDCILNLLTPNANYSGHTAPLTSKVAFYIFIQQI